MNKIEGRKYLLSLPTETQKLIDDVMATTIDMCYEFTGEDIGFFESAAYKAFKYEMMSHIIDNEYYDRKDKCWKNISNG